MVESWKIKEQIVHIAYIVRTARKCKNMYNEIIRKITSLTLMTIMLAGGMTIGFSGFTPDAYAANANLIVSAENTGYVAGAQVVEILVIDDDLSDGALPIVTVNGDAVSMTKADDGNYYAYIADTSEVAAVAGIINFTDAATGANAAVRSPVSDAGNDAWPNIQTYEFPIQHRDTVQQGRRCSNNDTSI